MLFFFSCFSGSFFFSPGSAYAFICKTRNKPNEVEKVQLLGDVSGKVSFVVDDMADTCGTIMKAADMLVKCGSVEVQAFVVHGIFSGTAWNDINNCKSLDRITCTNTIQQDMKLSSKLTVLDVSSLLASSIERTHTNQSISVLFKD